jgi:hypothetical protein
VHQAAAQHGVLTVVASSNAKWLQKLARDTQRERLRRARAAVVDARKDKRTAAARARLTCKRARASAILWIVRERDRVRAAIEQPRLELRRRIDAKRAGVRKCCSSDKQRTRAAHDAKIAETRAALEQLREEHKRARIWSKPDTLGKPRAAARRGELAQEDNDKVEANLSPDELTVWRKVRKSVPAATARVSRLEQFQHWLHDHSGEVARILEEDAQRAYREAVRNEQRERKALRNTRTPRELAEYVRAELADVPF